MAVSTRISPLNSLIFVHGPAKWVSPLPVRGQLIWSTPSCVATACYPEIEGPTEIVLGVGEEVALQTLPAFDGMVDTPEKLVVVTTVGDDEPVLQLGVSTALTRVRIWHSDPRWPEIVAIGLN